MADKRGRQPSKNQPSKQTAADQRKNNPDGTRRGKKPGPKPGSAAAAKGSAAGGRKSRKK